MGWLQLYSACTLSHASPTGARDRNSFGVLAQTADRLTGSDLKQTLQAMLSLAQAAAHQPIVGL